MSDTNLRVRSVSEIVDAAFSLYRRNGMQYITLAALATAPSIIASLLLNGGVQPATAGDLGKTIPVLIIGFITYGLTSAVIVRMGSDVYLGETPDVAATVRSVLPTVPAIVGATFVTGFLLFLSALLLLFPFFYVLPMLFATVPIIVLERRGVMAAVSRSAKLSDGIKLHILGTLALVYGIFFILSIGIPLLMLAVDNPVVQLVVQSLFSVVAAPIVNLVVMVLYYDARIRTEGFDVEHMAQSLGTSPAAA